MSKGGNTFLIAVTSSEVVKYEGIAFREVSPLLHPMHASIPPLLLRFNYAVHRELPLLLEGIWKWAFKSVIFAHKAANLMKATPPFLV